MAAPARIVAFALFAGLAVIGLALGAESQRESVVETDLQKQGEIAASEAAGNLVVLTGLLVALGVAGGALLLSRRPLRHRLGPAAVLATATYAGVLAGQTMWPSYVVVVEQRFAQLSNSLLAANLPGVPSMLVAPLGLQLAAILAVGWAGRRLLGEPRGGRTPDDLLRGQAAATLLAVPFLAVAAWGNLRMLFALPGDRPGLGPAFVVLPATALACLALAVLPVVKTWHLGSYVRNARLGAATQETWQTLGRVEGVTAVVLGALCLAGTFLQAIDLPQLQVGLVFGATLRGHTQLLLLLAVPLLPLASVHRAVARAFDDSPLHPATLDDSTHATAWWVAAAAAASLAGAAIATWAADGALWPWTLALLPTALAAALRCGARASAPAVLLLAYVAWAMGNTVEATYDGGSGNGVLSLTTPPGFLALGRTLAAVVAAAALARLGRRLGPARLSALPVAAGAGLALGAVALLEMPLTAWLSTRTGIDAISVGSVVASLEPPVRAIVHTVAGVLGVASAILVAMLHRPEWFQRRPRGPVAVVRPKRQAASAPA